MSALLRPIRTIAFASAFLASGLGVGVPANIAFAGDCLTAPILPRRRTATGTIAQIGRKSVSVGTYKRITVLQNREPCRLRAKRQPSHRNLLR